MRVRKIVHGFVYFAVVIAVFGVDILFSKETTPGSVRWESPQQV